MYIYAYIIYRGYNIYIYIYVCVCVCMNLSVYVSMSIYMPRMYFSPHMPVFVLS